MFIPLAPFQAWGGNSSVQVLAPGHCPVPYWYPSPCLGLCKSFTH